MSYNNDDFNSHGLLHDPVCATCGGGLLDVGGKWGHVANVYRDELEKWTPKEQRSLPEEDDALHEPVPADGRTLRQQTAREELNGYERRKTWGEDTSVTPMLFNVGQQLKKYARQSPWTRHDSKGPGR